MFPIRSRFRLKWNLRLDNSFCCPTSILRFIVWSTVYPSSSSSSPSSNFYYCLQHFYVNAIVICFKNAILSSSFLSALPCFDVGILGKINRLRTKTSRLIQRISSRAKFYNKKPMKLFPQKHWLKNLAQY